MLLLKHGKFLERLKTYSEKLDNQLIITSEDYTSKTCGRCGNIDKKLGSKEIYTCEKCNYKEDRDLNGARNILLKLISRISG
jgi:transposase